MNREIKFRAWDKGNKIWQYFTLNELANTDPHFAKFLENWCEYTGLKNKNSVEIWEGDLFSAWDNRSYYIVEWNEQSAGFRLAWIKGSIGDSKSYHYFEMLMAEYQFEPTGNIYENPELLKGGMS